LAGVALCRKLIHGGVERFDLEAAKSQRAAGRALPYPHQRLDLGGSASSAAAVSAASMASGGKGEKRSCRQRERSSEAAAPARD
jgi:hypothetical protein